jgi:hypothetical protein
MMSFLMLDSAIYSASFNERVPLFLQIDFHAISTQQKHEIPTNKVISVSRSAPYSLSDIPFGSYLSYPSFAFSML